MKKHKLPLGANPWLINSHNLRLVLLTWSITLLVLAVPKGNAAPTPPVVNSFIPTSGTIKSEVAISGENLSGTTAVRFNGVAATFRVGFSGSDLVAVVPAGATSGPISIESPAGNVQTAAVFTVLNVLPPQISGFSPQSGPVGTLVSFTGQSLSDATSVSFNNIPATFTVFGDTIAATVPDGATTGPVTIVTPAGSTQTAASFTVTAFAVPVITSVAPNFGIAGDRITIQGHNLEAATVVRFNGSAAAFEVFGSSVFANIPATAKSGLISVETPSGIATSPTVFNVLTPLSPTIASFSPESGPEGTTVTLSGTNFVGTTQVTFAGKPASFVVVSGAEISAVVPPTAGDGPIFLTTAKETVQSVDSFLVAATITSFEPPLGRVGTVVTIHGTHFSNIVEVAFGNVSATFTVISPNQIQAVVPNGATSGDIAVATPAGFGYSADAFSVPPKISQFDPLSGLPGSEVTVTGEGLSGATRVQVGGVDAAFSVVSDTSLTIVIPTVGGNGPITVTTPAGSSSSSDSFYSGLYADLAVLTTTSPAIVAAGGLLSYTVTVTNRGPLNATGVVLTDQLPVGSTVIFAPSGAACSVSNLVITCNLGALASGADVAIQISTSVSDQPYLTNQVTALAAEPDPNLSNNSLATVTTLQGAPPLPSDDVALTVLDTGAGLTISWPTPLGTFVLESAAGLEAGAVWTPVGISPTVANGISSVSVDLGSSRKFYRLRK